MEKVKVKLSQNPYEISVGEDNLNKLQEVILKNGFNKNILAVIDKNVYTLYKKKIEEILSTPIGKFTFLQLESKESNKSVTALKKIYSSLVISNYGRDSMILAIGGGIIGDLAGFAAATYSRGIQYIQVPTTLLAAVDSSVGGKTGINFGDTKNIVGSFYQPKFVCIDTSFLTTLPRRELISGMGEILKYAFLTDEKFFDYIDNNFDKLMKLDKTAVTKVIKESVAYKASVVIEDEKEESGLRKILNLGHTFAHAVEVEKRHRIKHGEAVIIGLTISLYLSNRIGLMPDVLLERGIDLINKTVPYIKIRKYDKAKMLDVMKRDKKSRDETYRFVLTKDIGETLVDIEADKDDITWAIDKGMALFT